MVPSAFCSRLDSQSAHPHPGIGRFPNLRIRTTCDLPSLHSHLTLTRPHHPSQSTTRFNSILVDATHPHRLQAPVNLKHRKCSSSSKPSFISVPVLPCRTGTLLNAGFGNRIFSRRHQAIHLVPEHNCSFICSILKLHYTTKTRLCVPSSASSIL